MKHIGFTGTRYGCKPAQYLALSELLGDLDENNPWGAPLPYAHHGDCIGADAEFHAMAFGLEWPVVIHPPVDNAHRANCMGWVSMDAPQPHMQRNRAIVAAADIMIACPFDMTEQTRGGTWKTIGFTRKAGKPLAIVWPDGTVTRERWV